jgi:hypothetical protein
MNIDQAATLIYGNDALEPEKYTGFMPRFNDLSASNGENIIDAGGTGSDNTSILLSVWGPNTVHGIYPPGSPGGLEMKDLGEVTEQDTEGGTTGKRQVFMTHYSWTMGLHILDWQYVVRIANIDKSSLSSVFNNGTFASPSAHLPNLMFKAMRRVPNLSMGKPCFYMARDTLTMLMEQTSAATQGSTLKSEKVGGQLVDSLMGVPIRQMDAMSADEARVV